MRRTWPNALALSIGALLASSMALLVLVRIHRDLADAWRAWRARRAMARTTTEFAALSAIEFAGAESEEEAEEGAGGSEAGLMHRADDESSVAAADDDRGLISAVQQMAYAIGSAAIESVAPADPDARAAPVAPQACAGWGAAPGPVITAWTPILHD